MQTMEDSERQKFEESWKDAFSESEMIPGDSVWSNIDLKLDNEKMKRRVIYYQRLAAASVLFALVIGAWSIRYFEGNQSNQQLSINQSTNEKTDAHLDKQTAKENGMKRKIQDQTKTDFNNKALNKKEKPVNIFLTVEKRERSLVTNGENEFENVKSESNVNEFIQLNYNKKTEGNLGITLAYPSLFENLTFYRSIPNDELTALKPEQKKNESQIIEPNSILPAEEPEKKKKRTEGLWLAFGVATGTYNPGATSASPTLVSNDQVNASYMNYTAPQSNRASVGTAYSMGFSVGKKVADRWVILTGVNYLSQMINYTSNYATYTSSGGNQLKAAVSDYNPENASVAITSPHKVSSNSEFVSIPLQAGYLLINRKIGLQLNAGIASDIFLRNTLKDQSGQSTRYTQSSGESSPYRSMNWTGLASTELSYKMSRYYRISLVPGFRYSFQPSLKNQSNGQANPLILDVGFRFRYIFQ
jgi:hypothetical protein